jgi:hypothetical protein
MKEGDVDQLSAIGRSIDSTLVVVRVVTIHSFMPTRLAARLRAQIPALRADSNHRHASRKALAGELCVLIDRQL